MGDRSAFLYLGAGRGNKQCGSCLLWVKGGHCIIHGPWVKVPASASCGYYLHGDPKPHDAKTYKIVTPEESGLVDRQVRCENCKWGGPDVYECGLFKLLNKKLPDVWELDTAIEPKGCCNAQEPPAENKEREKRLAEQEL